MSGAPVSRPLAGAGPDPVAIERRWTASYPPGVPPTYRYPDVLLTRFLDDAVRDFPDTTAVDAPGRRLSYHELRDVVDRLAGALEGLGVDPHRPLGLLLDRGLAYIVACFAAWRLGATVVPVDPSRPDPEVHRRLARAQVRVLITAADQIDRVRSIRGALPSLNRTVVTRSDDWLPRLRRVVRRLRPGRGDRARRLTSRDDVLRWVDVVDTSPPRSAQRHADTIDPALVLFDEDGDVLVFSHRQLVAAAFQSRLWIPDVQAGHERALVSVPADSPHSVVSGLLDPVLSAATIVIADGGDADAVAARVEDGTPTLLRGPAELFGKLAASGRDLSSLRASLAVTGGLDGDTVERFAEASGGARLRRSFGPVAACGLTHANPVYGRAEVATVGLPVSDTLAAVVDPDDPARLVEVGATGRLLVRGPQVTTARVIRDPGGSADRAVGPDDGWFDTGLLASVDADGWFTLASEPATGAQVGDTTRSPAGRLEGAESDHEDVP